MTVKSLSKSEFKKILKAQDKWEYNRQLDPEKVAADFLDDAPKDKEFYVGWFMDHPYNCRFGSHDHIKPRYKDAVRCIVSDGNGRSATIDLPRRVFDKLPVSETATAYLAGRKWAGTITPRQLQRLNEIACCVTSLEELYQAFKGQRITRPEEARRYWKGVLGTDARKIDEIDLLEKFINGALAVLDESCAG
jgi:hypothetical protein